ncbi:hypothetical protein [Cohnella panacarvi]|uniref:hypothetical protein n=1 Tax=Cohnella panacarvi TaxID=400776 RepID=UPI00047D50D0|nr:hypothetical protein [Cohnella panacarvi]
MSMNVNIGQLARALLGDAQPADAARALELRIGQIVRGVLLEMMDNQEGLVNINGLHVRAKLEADMPLGRGMLLQVQPSPNGDVVLKPLADATDALPEEALKDALKSFGLPDQRTSMELLRGLKRDGYPLTKETAAHFHAAMAAKPAGVDAQTWMGAADVAFRRGLTPTETTLGSLRQALFGQPLHEGLNELQTALSKWLGGEEATGSQARASMTGKDAVAAGQRLQQVLAQGAAIVAEGEAHLSGMARPAGLGAPAAGMEAPAQAAGSRPATVTGPAQPAAGAGTGTAAEATQAAGAGARAADAPRADSSSAANATSVAAPRPGAADAARPQAQALPLESAAQEPRAAALPAAPKQEAAAWIGRFLQWLGVEHEHKLLQHAEPLTAQQRMPGPGAELPASAPAMPGAADNPEARGAADTLKSALLALASHDDAPPALREAAQHLANQVTGQQLLLTSDRNPNVPLSHMTLFIPMKNENGDTTATVHVQSRRNRRGEWDADNCRLLFDLRMRHIGDTIVDVQVVDKIVSLKLLSDFPGMSELIEQARGELSAGMEGAGFQLLSLNVAPLPQWKPGSEAAAADAAAGNGLERTVPAGAYAAKPYKGVDFRA